MSPRGSSQQYGRWFIFTGFLPRILLVLTVLGVIAWAVYAWALTGKYEWKGRPWVRLQAGEVIAESTLAVKDSTLCDFYMPDDSATAHLAGWADSSNFALNAESLGGTIVPDDVLLSSRIDSTSNNFYHLGQLFLQGHVTISQDKWFYLKNSSTSLLGYDDAGDARVEWLNANGVEILVHAETLLFESDGEVGPLAIFADSSGDDVLTIYNGGGIALHKDWCGLDEWGASLTADTIEIIGVTAACPAFVTPHEVLSENVAAITKTDTLIVTRVVGGEVTDEGYSYLVMRP